MQDPLHGSESINNWISVLHINFQVFCLLDTWLYIEYHFNFPTEFVIAVYLSYFKYVMACFAFD